MARRRGSSKGRVREWKEAEKQFCEELMMLLSGGGGGELGMRQDCQGVVATEAVSGDGVEVSGQIP